MAAATDAALLMHEIDPHSEVAEEALSRAEEYFGYPLLAHSGDLCTNENAVRTAAARKVAQVLEPYPC